MRKRSDLPSRHGLASGKPARSDAAIIGDDLVPTAPIQCLVLVLAAVALVVQAQPARRVVVPLPRRVGRRAGRRWRWWSHAGRILTLPYTRNPALNT